MVDVECGPPSGATPAKQHVLKSSLVAGLKSPEAYALLEKQRKKDHADA